MQNPSKERGILLHSHMQSEKCLKYEDLHLKKLLIRQIMGLHLGGNELYNSFQLLLFISVMPLDELFNKKCECVLKAGFAYNDT